MKLGFAIPIVGSAVSSAAGLSAFCRGLEDLGYDTLWVGDRLVTPVEMHSTYPGREQPYPPQMTRYLDPLLLWTVAATATSRVRLNASTLSTFYYEPPHLARMLTTLDVLSDGRLDVGVGLGWMKDEHDIARSADWHRRGRMLDDLLAFLHEWWTTTPVSWDSEFLSLPPVHADLRPVQPGGPPIWIGGFSEGGGGPGRAPPPAPRGAGRRPRSRRAEESHPRQRRNGHVRRLAGRQAQALCRGRCGRGVRGRLRAVRRP